MAKPKPFISTYRPFPIVPTFLLCMGSLLLAFSFFSQRVSMNMHYPCNFSRTFLLHSHTHLSTDYDSLDNVLMTDEL